jgi:hypothetical protein
MEILTEYALDCRFKGIILSHSRFFEKMLDNEELQDWRDLCVAAIFSLSQTVGG